MRIALLTSSDGRIGGVESYVEHVTAALVARGHDVSVWVEHLEPDQRRRLSFPPSVDRRQLGAGAIDALREWGTDVLFAQKFDSPACRGLADVVPTIVVAHNHDATCVSGRKAWSRPTGRPCRRPLGPLCLAHYFPHGCGGLNPLTLARLYAAANTRLAIARRCSAVVTLSEYMRAEYLRHGFAPSRVHRIHYAPPAPAHRQAPAARLDRAETGVTVACVARLRPEKGVHLLLEAAPTVADRLRTPVKIVIVGDGTERTRLERLAGRVAGRANVQVTFRGWLPPAARDEVLLAADVLVVPSIWPEPFGLVGLEAAHLGLPAVAFDVGGVRDWLVDGETGCLASADPPRAESLAHALVACLEDDRRRAAMGQRARARAARHTPATHAEELERLMDEVLHGAQRH